jgi:hypothetical protein
MTIDLTFARIGKSFAHEFALREGGHYTNYTLYENQHALCSKMGTGFLFVRKTKTFQKEDR